MNNTNTNAANLKIGTKLIVKNPICEADRTGWVTEIIQSRFGAYAEVLMEDGEATCATQSRKSESAGTSPSERPAPCWSSAPAVLNPERE